MVKLTRGKVAYNFKQSPYKQSIKYDEHTEVEYVFSSEFYKNNFNNRLKENRDKINESLTKRFNIWIELDILADFKLYTTIEKRGFLIYVNGEAVECLDYLELVGTKINKSS